VREDAPSTLTGATGIVDDFVNWVQDEYRNIQTIEHGVHWFFRQSLDQTLAISASDDDYAMPAGLETLNWRTVTVYITAKTDESPVCYKDYYDWRMDNDTITSAEGKPVYITEKPDGVLQVFPVPDQAYTLRFDGVLSVDVLSGDADVPIIPTNYQYAIVWGAVMRFAKHHEDGAKFADAKDEFQPIFDAMVERQLPPVRVIKNQLF
jgi:hypothetical protein